MRSWFVTIAAAALCALVAAPARAAAPADLLEKAIYAEETKGDLAGAIQLYKEISAAADAERPVAAQALLRLGSCQLKAGRKEEAAATFRKLSKEYPEQKALIARIPPQATALALGPAPWGRSETLLYQMKMPGSNRGATMAFRIEDAEKDGKRVSRLTTYRPGIFTQIHVEADTFEPIDGRMEHLLTSGSAKAAYASGHVDVTVLEKAGGEPKTTRVSLDRALYDNEEVVQLIRRLPLAEGYAVTIPILAIGSPVTPEVKIEVTGSEPVTVPAGSFDTFKVRIGIFMDGRHIQDQTLWYTKDAKRYPVKLDNVVAIELSAIQTGTDEPVSFRDAGGLALTAPGGWLLNRSPSNDEEIRVDVSSPDMNAVGTLTSAPLNKGDSENSALEIAGYHVEYRQKNTKVYTVRKGPEAVETGGATAAVLVADYSHPVSGQVMVEHHAILSHGGRRIDLAIDTTKESAAGFAATFDELVRSLKLP